MNGALEMTCGTPGGEVLRSMGQAEEKWKNNNENTHGLFLFGSSNLKIVLSFTTVLNACQLKENKQNNVIM